MDVLGIDKNRESDSLKSDSLSQATHIRRPPIICAVCSLSPWGIDNNNATDTKGSICGTSEGGQRWQSAAAITISSTGLHIHQVSIYTMCQHPVESTAPNHSYPLQNRDGHGSR